MQKMSLIARERSESVKKPMRTTCRDHLIGFGVLIGKRSRKISSGPIIRNVPTGDFFVASKSIAEFEYSLLRARRPMKVRTTAACTMRLSRTI